MGKRISFDEVMLTRLRFMPLERAFAELSLQAKGDPTYFPVKDSHSRRWYVRSPRGEFEILATGVKWFDTRARRGGGGAIDLTMYLLGVSFIDAVMRLSGYEGGHGSDHS
jgi:hypothetical protein